MKTTIKYILITFFLISYSSCDDFLDESDPSSITLDDFYQTPEQAVEAINGLYEIIQDRPFYGQSMNMLKIDELRGDDIRVPVDPWNANSELMFEQFTFNATDGTIKSIWELMYRGINRANLALESIPDIMMDETLKNRLLAEASFMRAYFYFTLVRLWDGVPLTTKSSEGLNNANLSNETTENIYALIESDLAFGAGRTSSYEGLDLSYDGDDLSRVTRGAALGLLARAYLYQAKWAEAAQAARDVTTLGQYNLEDNYPDVFDYEKKYTNTEVVFHIDYHGDKSVINRAAIYTEPRGYFVNEVRLNSGRSGRARYAATWNGFNAFDEPGDSRKDYIFIYPTFTSWTRDPEGNSQTEVIDISDPGLFPPSGSTPFIRKYRIENQDGDNAPRGNANNAWPVIRYAEILLILAEAINESNNGPTGEAFEAINQVRRRARIDTGNPTHVPDLAGLDYNGFQEAVYKERRLELFFEGHRVPDLIRTGRYNQVTASKDGEAYFWEEKFRLLPIPQIELDLNQNENFRQNTGW